MNRKLNLNGRIYDEALERAARTGKPVILRDPCAWPETQSRHRPDNLPAQPRQGTPGGRCHRHRACPGRAGQDLEPSCSVIG
jgi:hypothetical protein